MTGFAEEFDRLYREAGGTHRDRSEALRDLFATYEQARVFAGELTAMFSAERERASELERTLAELQRSTEATQRSELRFRSLVSNSSDAVLVLDRGASVTYASAAAERVWGLAAGDLAGNDLAHILAEDSLRGLRDAVSATFHGGRDQPSLTLRARAGDGEWRDIEATIGQVLDAALGDGVVVNTRDVTDRKRLETELWQQAHHDSLTGLSNRRAFLEQLDRWTASSAVRPVTMLLVDIDRFKAINDSLGHRAGDQALNEIGAILASAGEPYRAMVSRLGGDEFGLLVSASGDGVDALVSSIVDGTCGAQRMGAAPSVSVGVADLAMAESCGVDLMRAADLALYEAKRDGRGRAARFSEATAREWMTRFLLEREISSVAERGELRVFYQAIVDMDTGVPVALESLVRWEHPERGLVSPLEFVPVAEETGAIGDIGAWVLEESCRQLSAWEVEQPSWMTSDLYLSVNVSAVELRDAEYVRRVRETMARHAVDPRRVQLEITESVLAEDSSYMLARLGELKALGVRLAIDDFGTGYSSLSYLARMPVDAIKVDRSFVMGMQDSPRMEAIVRATVTMAAALNLNVVAEGVESAAHRDHLGVLGCTVGQGFLYSRPVPASELGWQLDRQLDAA